MKRRFLILLFLSLGIYSSSIAKKKSRQTKLHGSFTLVGMLNAGVFQKTNQPNSNLTLDSLAKTVRTKFSDAA